MPRSARSATAVVGAPPLPKVHPKIVPLTELQLPFKVLIYGDMRTGKTTLASTAPKPCLFIDMEGGTHSIPDSERQGISIWRPESWEEVKEEVISYLYDSAANDGFKTVVFDSVTELGELCIAHILGAPGPTHRASPELMSKADWGVYAAKMMPLLREIRDVPDLHVVLTALAQDVEVEDDETGRVALLRRPMLGGKRVPLQGPSLFDIVAYVEMVEEEDGTIVQEVQLKPVGNRLCGIRSKEKDLLPAFITNPRLDTLFETLAKGQREEGGE